MSAKPNHSNLEAAIGKLHAFCLSHSLLKTDEELCNSFDSFFVRVHPASHSAENERLQKNYKALEKLLPILNELAKELIAERDQAKTKEIPQADFGNLLYASLKRHPE